MKWKSKKTLRIEADEYFDLWCESEGEVQRLHDTLKGVRTPMIYVLAKSQRRADQALENMHLIRTMATKVITEPDQCRGLRVENGAHIMYSNGWDQGIRGARLAEEWDAVLRKSTQWQSQRWICETI